MKNDMIELLKQLIDEENIRYQVREIVDEKFNYHFEKALRDKIDKCIGDKADRFIEEKINEIMNGKVRTDDGWGNVKEYGTFEDYVRKYIAEKLNNTWNIDKKIRDAVNNKLKILVSEIIEKREAVSVDNVLCELAKDILKEDK